IVVSGIRDWYNKNKKEINEALMISKKNLFQLLNNQIEYNIPIISIYLKTNEIKNDHYEEQIIKYLCEFLSNLKKDINVHKNKVKVSVLGKWYNLPSSFVNEIRDLIDETKDYDNYFLNFCLNYDGQEEIVDACKIISKKIEANIINSNSINKDIIKENLYSSYFLPPDLIIITGKKSMTHGMLLWDSKNSIIYFSKLLWPDFEKDNFNKAINYYKKER
ncbi:MAG: undecaprenyl diphosphate synthase family protein, partial [Candidatus Woesearchaeota archaeon]